MTSQSEVVVINKQELNEKLRFMISVFKYVVWNSYRDSNRCYKHVCKIINYHAAEPHHS